VSYKNCTAAIVVLLCVDNEVDGPTLLGLSETMIASLLPTMRLQVYFSNALAEMKRGETVINEPAVNTGQAVSK